MAGRKPTTLTQRFFEKVKKGEGCWEWTANRNNKGYGMMREYGPGLTLAHRVSYRLAYGDIPKGKWVLHRCDNPICVNPEHLFLGDHTMNVRDMHEKGRGWGGIGPETAYAILWEWASGKPRQQVTDEYGVTLHVVKDIAARRSWKSLSELHD